jgi:biofilm PGA synthesis N-glycosyltransferase PgaC
MSGRLMTLQHAHRAANSCNEIFHVNPSLRYLLISPCRDVAQYLRRTLDSVATQSVPPALWVVEDDGSTDETPVILKMDLPVRYFELRMLQRMESDPRVGS